MFLKMFNIFFQSLKNIYGRFWTFPEGYKEYYLKVDGYYYCPKNEKFMVIIRVRNKRTVDKFLLQEIINDKEYIKELHPVDSCIIGILANKERNNILDKNMKGIQKIRQFKNGCCFVKSELILYILKKYINVRGIEITVLRSKCLEKEIEIPTVELYKNHALLYALGTFQSISIGYDVSESFIKNAFGAVCP